jgi:hypothetical protein
VPDADLVRRGEAVSLTHYVVIRRDLTLGEFAAQLAHAGEAYALRAQLEEIRHVWKRNRDGNDTLHEPRTARMDETAFEFNETIAIVKGARNEAKLLKLEKRLLDSNVHHVAIREETGPGGRRLAGQLTCISLMPSSDPVLRELLNDFQEVRGLDPISSPGSSVKSADALSSEVAGSLPAPPSGPFVQADIAQTDSPATARAEHSLAKGEVAGSNPAGGSIPPPDEVFEVRDGVGFFFRHWSFRAEEGGLAEPPSVGLTDGEFPVVLLTGPHPLEGLMMTPDDAVALADDLVGAAIEARHNADSIAQALKDHAAPR